MSIGKKKESMWMIEYTSVAHRTEFNPQNTHNKATHGMEVETVGSLEFLVSLGYFKSDFMEEDRG